MLRHTLKRALVVVGLGLAAMDALAASGPAKASGWLGHSVITRDGKELGTVRDLAIDEQSGRVVYLVVSVGSFLIENNLIAVAPDALVPAGTDDGTFLLLADPAGLKDAKRFASDAQWPKKADVIRSELADDARHHRSAGTGDRGCTRRCDDRHRDDREPLQNREAFRERTRHHRNTDARCAGETGYRYKADHGDKPHERVAPAATDAVRSSRQRRRRRTEPIRVRAGDLAERQLLEDRHQRQRRDRAAGVRRVSASTPATELSQDDQSHRRCDSRIRPA